MNPGRSNTIRELRLKVFINRVVKTQVFPRMDVQDQLHSLSKLISLFEADYGVKPRSFKRIFHELNDKARCDMRKLWQKTYAHYNKMNKIKSTIGLQQTRPIEPVQQAIPMNWKEAVQAEAGNLSINKFQDLEETSKR